MQERPKSKKIASRTTQPSAMFLPVSLEAGALGRYGGWGGAAAPSGVPQLAQNLALSAFDNPQFGQGIMLFTVSDLRTRS